MVDVASLNVSHTFMTNGPPLSPSQASPLLESSGLYPKKDGSQSVMVDRQVILVPYYCVCHLWCKFRQPCDTAAVCTLAFPHQTLNVECRFLISGKKRILNWVTSPPIPLAERDANYFCIVSTSQFTLAKLKVKRDSLVLLLEHHPSKLFFIPLPEISPTLWERRDTFHFTEKKPSW